ncbi:hypothetical protein FACS189427_01300 [Planctomycetales bacterium]|nr:hypothetical protein FACS189427_01300 [Planctomycetales bacterium]
MPINVVCPGCLKRFKVSDRFAGMKGPCPNCNSLINIPKTAVKIHGAEEFDKGGKTVTGKLILKPLEHLDMDFNPAKAGICLIGVSAVFIIALLIGSMNLSRSTLDIIGGAALIFIAFPVSLFGYLILRDREDLFMLTGSDLYKKAGLCAAVYSAVWILFECTAWYTSANEYIIWFYFIAFAVAAAAAAHGILDINFGSALLHFLIFFVAVLFLRWAIGLDWIWVIDTVINHNRNLPPAPILPGM